MPWNTTRSCFGLALGCQVKTSRVVSPRVTECSPSPGWMIAVMLEPDRRGIGGCRRRSDYTDCRLPIDRLDLEGEQHRRIPGEVIHRVRVLHAAVDVGQQMRVVGQVVAGADADRRAGHGACCRAGLPR